MKDHAFLYVFPGSARYEFHLPCIFQWISHLKSVLKHAWDVLGTPSKRAYNAKTIYRHKHVMGVVDWWQKELSSLWQKYKSVG